MSIGDVLVSRLNGDDIKVGDFGLAAKLKDGVDFVQEFGQPEYVAPELASQRPASLASDIWSVGMISYVLLSGVSPFLGDNDRETLTRLQQAERVDYPEELFRDISNEGKDFLGKLLVIEPNGRLKVEEALQHPWLKVRNPPCPAHPDHGNLPQDSEDNIHRPPLANIGRLKDYHQKWRRWFDNASCKRCYRRRTLESCFHHPSKMIYPPGEPYTPEYTPPREAACTPIPPSTFPEEDYDHRYMRETINFSNESNYQIGPDTFLLQPRDPEFPIRLRQYMRVGAKASPSLAYNLQSQHWGDTGVAVRERRKMIDMVDEEVQDEWTGKTQRTTPMRFYHQVGSLRYAREQMEELRREVWEGHENEPEREPPGASPFFREKIRDTVVAQGKNATFRCLAIGEPAPYCTWLRNDGVLIESHRIKLNSTKDGRFMLNIEDVKEYDAGLYKVVARNCHGCTLSTARLLLGFPPGPPSDLHVQQASDSTLYLAWKISRHLSGNSPALGYTLQRRKHGEADWTTVAEDFSHSFYVVRDLSPSTIYQFRVKARNKFGWSEYSMASESVATLEAASGPVYIFLLGEVFTSPYDVIHSLRPCLHISIGRSLHKFLRCNTQLQALSTSFYWEKSSQVPTM
ncbi:SPEG [Cordylochernes scorpioides]|uniref:SPEG n=1 Tax=Cordylochernes scorpioides TaxID=51811 RepID=A0ABY6LVB8_9ARAC|nr:SPEG [Cordylochernes scorpioides]